MRTSRYSWSERKPWRWHSPLLHFRYCQEPRISCFPCGNRIISVIARLKRISSSEAVVELEDETFSDSRLSQPIKAIGSISEASLGTKSFCRESRHLETRPQCLPKRWTKHPQHFAWCIRESAATPSQTTDDTLNSSSCTMNAWSKTRSPILFLLAGVKGIADCACHGLERIAQDGGDHRSLV